MPGTVLTVASGKGGVGKTTTAVNLAVALWTEGNAVALVDADLGMANLPAVLGLEPGTTLHDVLAGRAELEDALVEAKDGDLTVLPGDRQLSGFSDADPGRLGTVLADLAGRYDFVVVDTGAGLSYEDVLPLQLADQVLLVTTPDPAAVGDTRKTLQLAGLVEGKVLGVVVTRAGEDTDAASVAAEIGADLLGAIPEDPAVTESTASGDPLASHAPGAPSTAAYAELAASIGGESVSRRGSGTDSRSAEAVAGGTSGSPADAADEPADRDEVDAAPDETTDEVAESEATEDEPADRDEVDAAPDEAAGPETPADGPGDQDDEDVGDEELTDDVAEAEGADAPDVAGEDVETPDSVGANPDDTEARGGLTGWLGRLFS